MSRAGFALLAVLWVLTVLAGTVGVSAAVLRTGQRATRNRVLLARGRWAAEACLAIAQGRWAQGRLADSATIDLGRSTTCRWRIEDPTAQVNVNAAPGDVLRRLQAAFRIPENQAERFTTAMLDGRRAREFWDLAAVAELPGFDPRLLPHLTVDGPGTVNANTAGAVVLAALPGLTGEAVHYLLRRRALGRPVQSLDELAGGLSAPARAELLQHYAFLAGALTFSSPQLRVTAEGWVASYGRTPAARVELLVVPLPQRLAVVRRRLS
jgi:type II secretory pathway component PulK